MTEMILNDLGDSVLPEVGWPKDLGYTIVIDKRIMDPFKSVVGVSELQVKNGYSITLGNQTIIISRFYNMFYHLLTTITNEQLTQAMVSALGNQIIIRKRGVNVRGRVGKRSVRNICQHT